MAKTFTTLVNDLAVAEADAKASGADTRAKSAVKSNIAVAVIKAAFEKTIDSDTVKTSLLDAGVLKGTVSKIVTVLNGIYDGGFDISDLVSLSGAYSFLKPSKSQRAAAAASAAAPATVEVIKEVVKEVPAQVTIKDVIPTILEHIRASKDPFKEGGIWMTKITQAITDETAKIIAEEEAKGK